MEYIPINIAHGVASTTPTVVYTVPAQTVAMLRSLLLVNKVPSDVLVNARVSFDNGVTWQYCIPKDLRLRQGSKYDDNSLIHLPATSKIEITASVDNAVDFIISGVASS